MDFAPVNALSRALVAQPELAIPPPPNIVHPARSAAVTKAKEEGNVRPIYFTHIYPFH